MRSRLISFKNISYRRFVEFYQGLIKACKEVKVRFLKKITNTVAFCSFELEVIY